MAKSCLTLCDATDYSTPGFPVIHCPLELAQMHVHWVSDVIQPSHPLSSPSPPALSLSQHQGLCAVSWLFTSGGQSIGASASILPFKIDWFDLLAVQGTLQSLPQHHNSKASIFGAKPSLWSNSHIHNDYGKNLSFD